MATKDEQKSTDIEQRMAELEARNLQLMAMLEAKVDAQANGFTPAVLRDIVAGAATAAATAAAEPSNILARKLKPENADDLHMSPFEHKKGGLEMPKPPFPREVLFAGARVRVADVNYPEALAIVKLDSTLARGQVRTCRDGKWKAFVSDDDKRLTVSVPMKTIDDRQDLPSFLEICQELTTGERSLDHADLVAEMAMLKAELAELSKRQAVSA